MEQEQQGFAHFMWKAFENSQSPNTNNIPSALFGKDSEGLEQMSHSVPTVVEPEKGLA